jgi:hypothetical protein
MLKLNPGWMMTCALFLGVGGRAMAAEAPPVRPVEIKQNSVGTDAISVQDASISGDTLKVKVRHSGGCRDHLYGLTWDGTSTKTIPPQLPLSVTHNAQGDNCKANVNAERAFDLKPIKEKLGSAGGKGALLKILGTDGSGKSVHYQY